MTRAVSRTYIQEKDYEGVWRLIVEVTEKASDKHKEVIQTIQCNDARHGHWKGTSSGDEAGHFTMALRCSMVSHESVAGHGHVARHGWRPLGL